MIILDVGEGTVLNKRTVGETCAITDAVAFACDKTGFPREQIVIKPQLFEYEPPNQRLRRDVFETLYWHSRGAGFKCTASVFDKSSTEYLLAYNPPFVKIALRPYLRKFISLVPRGIDVVVSIGESDIPPGRIGLERTLTGFRWRWPDANRDSTCFLFCCDRYPSEMSDYEVDDDMGELLRAGVSDHTIGLDLYRKYRPEIYEKHFGLKGFVGPSLGDWSIDEHGLEKLLTLAKETL